MTTYELIQILAQYPSHTRVTIARDWSAPIVDDSYQQIEDDPTVTLKSSGWAAEPSSTVHCSEGDCSESGEPTTTVEDVARQVTRNLHEAATSQHIDDALKWVHIYATLVH